jgi:hypothetical protein
MKTLLLLLLAIAFFALLLFGGVCNVAGAQLPTTYNVERIANN